MITEDESKNVPSHMLVDLFLDIYCDNACKVERFKCPKKLRLWNYDLLRDIYSKHEYMLLTLDGNKVLLPSIPVVVMSKAESLLEGERTEQKMHKDECDIVALLLYSDTKLIQLKETKPISSIMHELKEHLSQAEVLERISKYLYKTSDVRYLKRRLEEFFKYQSIEPPETKG